MTTQTRDERSKIAWKTQIPGIRNAISPPKSTRPNPIVHLDRVFVSTFAPGLICALNRDTGELLWIRKLDSYASSGAFIYKQDLFAASCRTLYCLNSKDGEIRWTFTPEPSKGEWIYSLPVVSKDRVFIGDRCGKLHCLDARTGRPIWRRQLSRGDNNQVNSTSVVIRGTLVSANNEGKVACLDTETGKTLWRQHVDGPVTGELLRFRARVIVTANSLFEIDPGSGALLRKTGFQGKRVVSVTVSGSRIGVMFGADFESIAAAWNDPSAFNGQLVVFEKGQEIARVNVLGTPALRTCNETGLIFAANHYGFSAFDSSNGHLLGSRHNEFTLPSYSKGMLYGLTGDGLVISEHMKLGC